MSDFLNIRLHKTMKCPFPFYFWPLIFEAMHRGSLQFPNPTLAENKGTCYSDTEYLTCTFQEMWDMAMTRKDNLVVFFWVPAQVDPPFGCDVSVSEKKKHQWEILMTVENTMLIVKKELYENGTMQHAIRSFFLAAINLYEFLAPCTINVHWDESFVNMPLLKVRTKTDDSLPEPFVFSGRTLTWKEFSTTANHRFFIPDPLPHVIGRGDEPFLSLF